MMIAAVLAIPAVAGVAVDAVAEVGDEPVAPARWVRVDPAGLRVSRPFFLFLDLAVAAVVGREGQRDHLGRAWPRRAVPGTSGRAWEV